MTYDIFNFLKEWGIIGVLVSLFIEGSAFPFIGTFFVITMGFIMDLTWLEIFYVSIIGSLLYTFGSYIPYFIGYKLGISVKNRLEMNKRKNLEKTNSFFNKYGAWSVALTSPLPIGNAVPIIAGMSKMKIGFYTLFTMIGITPTTFLFLSLGRIYQGNPDIIIKKINDIQLSLLIGFMIISCLFIWKVFLNHRKHSKMVEHNIDKDC